MNKINSYKDLIVWQKAIALVELIYMATSKFPKAEIYGLTSQMRRSSISIPSNIAEGFGRKKENDYKRFYRIAYGSALELETQIEIAIRLNYLNKNNCIKINKNISEVCKMLNVMGNRTAITDPIPSN